jgi:hypothetical protein
MAKTQKQKLLDGHDVDKETGCWNWTGRLAENGYGRVSAPGGNAYHLAHRASYREFVGPIPSGLCVCHKCDNRRCINPEHLWLGTRDDNMKDMVAKNRSLVGEKHPNSRLDAELVRQIREDAREYRAIAAEYGITFGMVGHIKLRRAWRHVP